MMSFSQNRTRSRAAAVRDGRRKGKRVRGDVAEAMPEFLVSTEAEHQDPIAWDREAKAPHDKSSDLLVIRAGRASALRSNAQPPEVLVLRMMVS